MPGAEAAPAPKNIADKLPSDVGKFLSNPSLPGLGGASRFPGLPGLGNMDPSKMDPAQLEAMARQMGIDPAAVQQAAGAAPQPKQLSDKLPADVGQLLKSGSGVPGLGGQARFPGLPGLGGGFVPKKK